MTDIPISELPNAAAIQGPELIPVVQAGTTVQTTAQSVLEGLSVVSGINISNQAVLATGATTPLSIAKFLSIMVPIESFGGASDGTTDCAAALIAASAAGIPVYFGPGTYIVNGECDLPTGTVIFGDPNGQTIITRRTQGTSGIPAWIYVAAGAVILQDVTFDGDVGFTTSAANGFVIGANVVTTFINRCTFQNVRGSTPYINGLTYLNNAASSVGGHRVTNSNFIDNQGNGLQMGQISNPFISGNIFTGNGGTGFIIDIQDPAHVLQFISPIIEKNYATTNAVGIQVGDASVPGSTDPTIVYGIQYMRGVAPLINSNVCVGNTGYEMVVSGVENAVVSGNVIGPGGFDANCTIGALIKGNSITSTALAGIGLDIGGSVEASVIGNTVIGFIFSCSPGGSTNCSIKGNYFYTSGTCIAVKLVEGSNYNPNFGIVCSGLIISGNTLNYSNGNTGINFFDGASAIVTNNDFIHPNNPNNLNEDFSAIVGAAQNLLTQGNTFSGQYGVSDHQTTTNTLTIGAASDICVDTEYSGTALSISTIATANQLAANETIAVVRYVPNSTYPNSGFTFSETATITDPTGTGAQVYPQVYGGVIINVAVGAGGSGYTSPTITFSNGRTYGISAGLGTQFVAGKAITVTNGGGTLTVNSSATLATPNSAAVTVAPFATITFRAVPGGTYITP